MTERDGAWMARILARFTPEMVRTLADMGQFSEPEDTRYLGDILEARLERILDRYLTRLSPLDNVHVEEESLLCATDPARKRRLRDVSLFRYDARASSGETLSTTPRDDGSVCVALPPPAADDRSPQYRVVSITNGVAQGALAVHLYDLGPTRGYRVAGVERRPPGGP